MLKLSENEIDASKNKVTIDTSLFKGFDTKKEEPIKFFEKKTEEKK